MNKASCLSIILGIALIAIPVLGAEPEKEDLLKRGGSFSAPGIVTNQQKLPPGFEAQKAEMLKALADEKLKSAPERDLKKKDSEQPMPSGKEPVPPVKDAQQQLQKEIPPPSALEKMITSDETLTAVSIAGNNQAKELTQFGYGFFRNAGFAPQTDVPVNADYLVGPGDTIILTVWGSFEGTHELTVSRSGEVVLPKVGPVKVAGVPFGKLPHLFRVQLGKVFRDFQVAVNMGQLRTIKVYVVGEVAAPGDYSISSLSTLLNALSAAGGPTKNGSLRNVKVRRAAGGEENVDLYDFFTRGDKSRDIRLDSGDTIFVPVIGRIAAISGSVKRPGIYELKQETTLKDLLQLAEGMTATGYLQRVQVSRVVANEKKKVLDLNLDSRATGKTLDALAAEVPIQDMDIVRVFPINALLRDHFRIEGHVERPGFYALRPGMRLSSVLNHDGLLPEYYPDILEITRLVPPDLSPQKMVVNLEAALAGDPKCDLEIKEYDIIHVFPRTDLEAQPKVKISGDVQKPGEYRLYKNMTVRDLLVQAGNPNPTAYLADAEINRIKKDEEKVTSFAIGVNLAEAIRGDQKHNIMLAPFDELVVKRLPNWAEETERYVTLKGEFKFPGVYPIYRGEKLSNLIQRAGGFSEKAYLRGLKFTRESVRELQQKRLDEVIAKTEEELATKQAELASVAASKEELEATKAALDGLRRQVEVLKTRKAEGRLILTIDSLDDLKNSRSDLELMGGDALYVPKNPEAVNVLGQVYNPSSIVHVPDEDVTFYLDKVGGPTKDSAKDEMYLVKIDGSVISSQQKSGFFFNRFGSEKVMSGDTIVVPQSYEKVAWMRDIKDIAMILGQLALTAGVIVAAGL